MRKVCCLICLCLLLLSVSVPANAEGSAATEDSVTIPQEVLACLDADSVDTIFCVYLFGDQFARCTYEGFPRYGDIDSVLANTGPELQRCYFVKDKAGETTVYTYDGESLSRRLMGLGSWFGFHGEKAENIIQTIDAGIVVENIYYLWYYNWTAIYYKTNLGDYVYISGGYLMGLEPFLTLQEELYWLALKYENWRDMDNQPYQVKLSQLDIDWSAYDLDALDFDPQAPLQVEHNYKPGKFIAIGSFVLLIALIVGRFLIRGHWKYQEKKERMASRI